MKERKRRSVLQSARADGDGIRSPPGHFITGAGREEVMRKGGGEEARSVRCMCDVCAAHGDRAAVGVDVDAQAAFAKKMSPTSHNCTLVNAVTLVTLVSHSHLLWRGVAQGGVDPVFPFRASP